MDRLYAPWRANYVKKPKNGDERCVFCSVLLEGPSHDEKNLILCRLDEAFVMMNLYPYNSGHLLVLPKMHTSNLEDLSTSTYAATTELLRSSIGILNSIYEPDGINIGINLGAAAGAGIPQHCHFHIVPRWNGDTNFMPVLADSKVLNEQLLQSYKKLRPKFSAL